MTSYLKIIFCIVLLATTQASFAQDDPCADFPGNWQGTWQVSYCKWETTLLATMYKDIVRLTGKVYGSGDCYDQEVTLTGTCVDGKVELGGYKGHMFSGLLTLQNSHGDLIIARKN